MPWSIIHVAGGNAMNIALPDAKAQLTDLVRRAEAGDEVPLTRHGQATMRLVPIRAAGDRAARRKLLEEVRMSGAARATPGADAARSQDFLHGEDGLSE